MALTLGAPDVAEIRPRLERAGLVSRRVDVSTPAINPDGDPLDALTPEERTEIEADPQRKKRFLERIEQAEAAERERTAVQRARDEVWAEIDARERADAAADRIVAGRANARGDQP
jgi:hypothetical protein